VLELIDGAVGAVPSVPRALLARAAVVITGTAAAALALTWWFNRMIGSLVQANPSWISTDYFGEQSLKYAPSSGTRISLVTTEVLFAVVCSGFAATVRALLRGRTARLFALATFAALPRVVLVALFALITRLSAENPGGGVGGWYFLICLCGVPLCFWLTSLTAVAAPAAALEGASFGAALRRSRRLAGRGGFRVGWTCLLTLLIAAGATLSLDVFGWQLRQQFGVGDQFAAVPGSPGFSWWLVAYAITYLLTLLLTTPYRAATATLLYVDRRFRREGLDIRIGWARLANVKQGSTS
jgi:hypothetical protein